MILDMDPCPPVGNVGPPGPVGPAGPPGAGIVTSNTLSYAAGVLTSTVNGVTATINLLGQMETDAFGVPLGYLLGL